MKEEVLIKLRNELESARETLKQVKPLLEDENVSKFISLMGIDLDKMLITEDKESKFLFHKYNSITTGTETKKDTNNIYFKYGTHGRITKTGRYIEFDKTYEYKDLENPLIIEIVPETECEEFEKTHDVITSFGYFNVQEEFITEAVLTDQETAKKKIIKKYGIKKSTKFNL